MSNAQHLVDMANDIGHFFRAQPSREEAICGIENHIKSYWTRSMRAKVFAQMEHGDAGLEDLPREALQRLRQNPGFKPDQPPGGDAG